MRRLYSQQEVSSMVVHMEVRISLIDARIDAGFNSQAGLAKAANVAESTVWGAENGRAISYRSARKIVNALKQRGMQLEVADLSWSVLR
jgi:DNA-binding XRE family transcriptional regulator